MNNKEQKKKQQKKKKQRNVTNSNAYFTLELRANPTLTSKHSGCLQKSEETTTNQSTRLARYDLL